MDMNLLKRILLIALAIIVVLGLALFGFRVYTKSFSPEATVSYASDDLNIAVTYCRPYKHDREIFGGLVPYNQIWRTGANEATTFFTDQNLEIEGQVLNEGTYGLFTIPRPDSWTIIFNYNWDQWGAYDYDRTQDALRIEVPSHSLDSVARQFTIQLEDQEAGVAMHLFWDRTLVTVPLKKVN